MTFTHVQYPVGFLPKLRMKNINGKRHYVTPCGILPSITTVLSIQNQQGLIDWKNNVGPDVAKLVARNAAIRGNCTHKIIQDYLSNNDISIHQKKILPIGLFNIIKDEIDLINNIHAIETPLFSSQLGVAGRVDTIAEYHGVPSVIDFKTSTKPKKKDWIENYFLQETAYSLMWKERSNNEVEQIVTIIACETGEAQTFIEKPKNSFAS